MPEIWIWVAEIEFEFLSYFINLEFEQTFQSD
jgi:hypothetical protein